MVDWHLSTNQPCTIAKLTITCQYCEANAVAIDAQSINDAPIRWNLHSPITCISIARKGPGKQGYGTHGWSNDKLHVRRGNAELAVLTALPRWTNLSFLKGVQTDGGWPSTVNHNLCVIIQWKFPYNLILAQLHLANKQHAAFQITATILVHSKVKRMTSFQWMLFHH